MRLACFFVFISVGFIFVSLLSDCFLLEDDDFYDPVREQVLKRIPKMIKRSYNKWNLKDKCIDKVIRSTNANVKLMDSEWFMFSCPLPQIMTPLLNSRILLEFHKVDNITEASKYNYSISIRNAHGRRKNKSPNLKKLKKLVMDGDSAELYFNITSTHLRLMSSGRRHMRLRYNLFISDSNTTYMATKMPFKYSKLKAYLITLEDNKNCTLDFMSMNAQKLLKLSKTKSMLRTLEKISLYPVNEDPRHPCQLTNWFVPFSQIGWGSFVIAPSVVNAKACTGTCNMPLLTNTTQHALLQAAVSYAAGLKTSVCCVPLTTEKITLIVYDDVADSVLIIKSENLVATSCGCR